MRVLVVLGASLLVACSPTPQATSTPVPSTEIGAGNGADLPTGCAPIDLQSPIGERVDLGGVWVAVEGVLVDPLETAWLFQAGDCLYGSVMDTEFLRRTAGDRGALANLSGRLTSAFTIPTDVLILVHPPGVARMLSTSQMTLLIEWDADGRIRLREDRMEGEPAERCGDFVDACPDPLMLMREGDAPSP